MPPARRRRLRLPRLRRAEPRPPRPDVPSEVRTDAGSAPARAPDAVTSVGGATDRGPWAENQDRWASGPGWLAVCDGVGGHRGGAIAAQLALDTVVGPLGASGAASAGDDVGRRLREAAEQANAAVWAGRAADPAVDDMATTLTMAMRAAASPAPPAAPTPEGSGGVEESEGVERWVVLQVGDSPGWHTGRAGARSVTWDHSLVGDLVRTGAITPEEARRHPSRHVVTRAIGIASTVEPEVFVVDLAPGDALVLASDGLSDVAGPEVVPLVVDAAAGREVGPAPPTATAVAQALVAEALARGTRDNVTVVVALRPPSPARG